MTEIQKIPMYGLTDIYNHYLKYKECNRLELQEAFATLYKMYGGKKDVGSINFDMFWYIETIERLHRAWKKHREKTLEHEKIKNTLNSEDEQYEEDVKFKKEIFEFYKKRFGACIDYLQQFLKVSYHLNNEKGYNLSYTISLETSENNNDYLLSAGLLSLLEPYALGEVTENLRKIFCDLRRLKGKIIVNPYAIIDVNHEISHVLSHTKLSFTNIEIQKVIK